MFFSLKFELGTIHGEERFLVKCVFWILDLQAPFLDILIPIVCTSCAILLRMAGNRGPPTRKTRMAAGY